MKSTVVPEPEVIKMVTAVIRSANACDLKDKATWLLSYYKMAKKETKTAQSALARELLAAVKALKPMASRNIDYNMGHEEGLSNAMAALRAKCAELGVKVDG